MTNMKKILAEHKTTTMRITAWDHAYLKAVAAIHGTDLTEAVSCVIRERQFPITVVIRKNIIKDEAVFYTAALTVNEMFGKDDDYPDFHEGTTKAGATQAALDLIKDLGLGHADLDYRTENLDDGTVIRDEMSHYFRGKMRLRSKIGDALRHGVLPAPKPRCLARQAA